MLTVTNKMITAGPARATQGIDFPKADRWGNTIRLETQRMYDSALCYARRDHFKTARCVFRRLLEKEDPRMCKAWVSWAQMEKRAAAGPERWDRCREILQRGLAINPNSACLAQAFGLLCLQRGPSYWLAALLLLERSVSIDPQLQPVLNWAKVHEARRMVEPHKRKNRRAGQQCQTFWDMAGTGSG